MKRAQAGGLIFNKEKCKIKQKYIRFFGLIFNEEGAQPDPERIKAIQYIKPPTNKTQLQEFLGIATYMSHFVPNLSTHTAPLRDLIKKDTDFTWTSSHEKKFNDIKDQLLNDRQMKAAKTYNITRRNTPNLNDGQKIFIRNPITSTWSPGTILQKHTSPNSYLVDSEQHSTVRRNLTDIRRDNVATRESPSITPPPVAYERPLRHRRPPNRLDLGHAQ